MREGGSRAKPGNQLVILYTDDFPSTGTRLVIVIILFLSGEFVQFICRGFTVGIAKFYQRLSMYQIKHVTNTHWHERL